MESRTLERSRSLVSGLRPAFGIALSGYAACRLRVTPFRRRSLVESQEHRAGERGSHGATIRNPKATAGSQNTRVRRHSAAWNGPKHAVVVELRTAANPSGVNGSARPRPLEPYSSRRRAIGRAGCFDRQRPCPPFVECECWAGHLGRSGTPTRASRPRVVALRLRPAPRSPLRFALP